MGSFKKLAMWPPVRLSVLCSRNALRFAGGEGAQRRSRRRIYGTRPKGRTPRAGRSVAHTCHRLHQQRQLKWRASGGSERERRGPSTSTRRGGEAGQTEALSTRILQAGDGEAESSSPTRKATPARGKTLGRHVSAARRPDPESGDAPARVASVLDPAGEERSHRAGSLGPAPGAAAGGNHSPTTG